MRRWQSCTLSSGFALCSVIVILMQYRIAAPQTAEPNISFLWALGAVRADARDAAPVAITQGMVLHTGDQFKMIVQLQKRCFVYILLHSQYANSSEDEVTWLFPSNKQQFDTDYQIGKRYNMPPGDSWYKLDQRKGRETVYLLASAKRLSALEDLLEASAAAKPAERPQLTARILAAIRTLGQGSSLFAATSGERPTRIGGSRRDVSRGKDVGDLAIEITAQDFYRKMVTIEHQ
jgi:Domain of unknown function (DUF4384)